MNKRVSKIITFLAIIYGFFIKAGFALALELEIHYPNIFGFSINNTSSFPEYIRYFFNLGMILAAFITVIVIAFGGIYYLVDYGRGKFTSEAKDWIKSGIMGLIIVFCSYLIAYTINPDLVFLKFGKLLPIPAPSTSSTSITPAGTTITSYQEIPIGTLTENLLTKTMDCYGFDSEGNPIDGDQIAGSKSSPVYGPTYMDHDRVDCLSKLTNGAQKKAETAANLSDEISKLMNKCNCQTYGQCEDKCGKQCFLYGTQISSGIEADCTGSCGGPCIKGSCQQPLLGAAPKDCCPTQALDSNGIPMTDSNGDPIKDSNGQVISVKQQIEHGPIGVGCATIAVPEGPDNWDDPSFREPPKPPPKPPCNVPVYYKTNSKLNATQNIVITSDINKADVQWAIDQWNKNSPPGFKFFGNIVVNNNICKSYACNDNSGSGSNSYIGNVKTTPPANTLIIYNYPIAASEGGVAMNNLHDNNGVLFSQINIDLKQPDFTSGNYSARLVMLHELGHSLGLGDSYDVAGNKSNPDCEGTSIMNDIFQTKGIGPDDIKTLNSLYGTSYSSYAAGPIFAGFSANQSSNVKFVLSSTSSSPANSSTDNSCMQTQYSGLDEFRCPNPNPKADNTAKNLCSGSAVANYVEVPAQVNGKKIYIINQKNWKKLNLKQQLMYFTEKIDQIRKAIKNDVDTLDKAKAALNKCYLAIPYVDLLKTYEKTDQTKHLILSTNFKDTNGSVIDKSKYCTGFNYNNSSCFKKCGDICPDTSPGAIQAYKNCPVCTDTCPVCNFLENPVSYLPCKIQRDLCENKVTDCKTKQEICIEKAYNSRPCTNSSQNSSQNFGDCIASCQGNCLDICTKEDPSQSSDEYNFCRSQCLSNSQCILNNAGSCLFNANGFAQCANQYTDQGNINYCINNAYLCKNGSDQYAGYQDCQQTTPIRSTALVNSVRIIQSQIISNLIAPVSSTLATAATAVSDKINYWLSQPKVDCSQDYSASFLYDHPECEKCVQPYQPPDTGSACFSTSNAVKAAVGNASSCQELCPEITKCPTSSNCPSCPCDQISTPDNPTKPLSLNFSVPNINNGKNAGEEGYITINKQLSAHEMVGPQCNGYSYNDDPLTFYCQDSWWTDPNREGLSQTPIGQERVCPQEGEVPVGQTIDDAEYWANNIIKPNKIDADITDMLLQMTKIGQAKDTQPIQDYCKCTAKFENNDSICKTDCKYHEDQVRPVPASYGFDAEGNPYYIPEVPGYKECNCTFKPCSGNPCEQVTDYLTTLWNDYRQLKLDFIDIYTAMIEESRSDIMKELSYSRKTTNDCSLISSAYDVQSRLLSCTRIEDELISPIVSNQIKFNGQTLNGYCYGKYLGNLFNESLTDNWYCCQQYSENPTQ